LSGGAESAQDQDANWTLCTVSDPDIRIVGCTAIIQAGAERAEKLAIAFNNRGLAYDRKGEYDRAVEDYDQAIRLNTNYSDAFYNRGSTYRNMGEYDRSIGNFDQAITLNPNHFLAFINRGNSYNDKGEYDHALQNFDEAIRLNPNYAAAFSHRGVAYAWKGEYDRAIQDFDRAIRLDPVDIDGHFGIGYARFCLGQFASADQAIRKVLRMAPQSADAAIWHYLSQARAGQNGQADLKKIATKLDLGKWPGQVILLFLGRTSPEAVLPAANDTDPKTDRQQHCLALFYLGEYALLRNDTERAAQFFRKAIETGVTECHTAQVELSRMASPR
jgi:tetratricopeptide (TPR) repeat protein